MKEGLKKLAGQSFNTQIGQIILINYCRQQQSFYDQLYFQTQLENTICKIYDIGTKNSQERYHKEKQVYQQDKYGELAEYLIIKEIQIKKKNYGVFLLKIQKKNFLKEIYTTLTYNDWLVLIETFLEFVLKLSQEKQAFLNINPWSIAKSAEGDFKFLDPQFLTQQGSFNEMYERCYNLIDISQKEYEYRAPELLDQYTKNKIDYKADLFSFAVVLYQLFYHKYPFESKLSQININYHKIEQQTFISEFVTQTLQPYAKRATLQQLKALFDKQRKKIAKEPTTKNMSSGSSTNQSKSSNIFSGFTQIFSKLTTETEGWYLNFTENDENRPEQKYVNNLIGKLYKKQAKLQKLQLIIRKYIDQSNENLSKNHVMKSLLLMMILFRKGPTSILNYQWQQIFICIEQKYNQYPLINELLTFCRKKLQINHLIKMFLKGNFYLEEFNKFKLITLDLLQKFYEYIMWIIDSITSKLLFIKMDTPILQFTRQTYCDQIMDLVSVIILSLICIKKDNELKFRKDNMTMVNQFQKKMNVVLKKISKLSNHVNGHAIYSLEIQYFYYKEEIQLRENPHFTSLEYFYKNCREYKGLCVPICCSLIYSTGDIKEFLSNQNNKIEKNEEIKGKNYFKEIQEDNQIQSPSFNIVQSPSPEKKSKKDEILEKLKIDKSINIKKDSNKLLVGSIKFPMPQKKKEEPKKTVNFQDFFKADKNPPENKQIKPNNQVNFNFNITNNKTTQPKKNVDFPSFEDFFKPKDPPPVKVQSKENNNKPVDFSNVFDNFQFNVKEKEKQKEKEKEKQKKNDKQKTTLGYSNSQKLIQDNFMNYNWLQNSKLDLIPKKQVNKKTVDPVLLNNVLSGLRLKELKEIITNNQQAIIQFQKLKLQKVIGSGSAGEVYLGQFNNEIVAIKKVKTKENPNALKQFQRQLLTYIKIKKSPYLVSLIGLSKSQEDYFLITEFCNSGSLFDLLHKRAHNTPLAWEQKIQLSIQIAKGMLALHQMNPPIIHRDLKSLNVFVIENSSTFVAKVADFGLSRSPQSQMMTMYLGTLHWMAPQLLDNKQYSVKVDVYSYAIVLWQICARKTPYNELSSPMAIIKHVTIQKNRPNMQAIPPDCPIQLIELMKACWAHEASERPEFQEIINKLSKIKVFT